MDLSHGGHLTHGSPVNFSGRLYKIVSYHVKKETGTIDYEEVERLAKEHKPKVIMARALELAERGRGTVTPNPRVGAVLVKDATIVAEGWHKVFGGPHAEVECLRQAEARGVDPSGGTMYVTLEPCNHFGKTPPCSRTLLDSGVARVVIGCLDPNPVAGGGADLLRQGGIEVTVGVLEQECRDAIADFVVYKTMTASASRPGAVMELIARMVSGASFLLMRPYCSRASCVARMSASDSGPCDSSSGIRRTVTMGYSASSPVTKLSASHSARYSPSKSTLMVPSGSRSIWRILLTVPISNRSSASGFSVSGERWATRNIFLS